VPTSTSSKYTFTWGKAYANDAVKLYYGTTVNGELPTLTLAATISGSGVATYTGSADQTIAASHNCVMVKWENKVADFAVGDVVARYMSDPKCYCASGVTTVSTGNVVNDILYREVATTYLPTDSSAYVTAEATTVEPLVFDSCDAKTKLDELKRYAAYDFGWFNELRSNASNPYPHWYAVSTTPDYVLRLVDAETWDLDEAALDELFSGVAVTWQDVRGRSQTINRADSTAGHPLVDAGITRYGDLSVGTSSMATASAMAALWLADYGREQLKGTVTTRKLSDVNGAAVYLPSVRPGKMLRLMGLTNGYVDTIVRRVTCVGDTIASIECDNEPYRLDIALAKLAKRQ